MPPDPPRLASGGGLTQIQGRQLLGFCMPLTRAQINCFLWFWADYWASVESRWAIWVQQPFAGPLAREALLLLLQREAGQV